MTRRFNPRLDPRIKESAAAIRRAKSRHRKLVSTVQKECKHEIVFETPWQPSTWCSDYKQAVRICCRCGLEEEAYWDRYEKLKTDAVITIKDRSEFYSKRVPGARVFNGRYNE